MKFVATKTADQLDLQALHRVRERLVGQRTGVINQIRAFLLERGIAVRQGLRSLRSELPGILATRTDVLSPRMLRIIEDLAGDWRRLDERIEDLSSEIEALARQDKGCERLMTVPGIGPIISIAMVAAIGTGDVFSKGRDFGAWLGLVPKQISTGDRTILGKISRRGNRYLRALFVQAAWVVLVKVKGWEPMASNLGSKPPRNDCTTTCWRLRSPTSSPGSPGRFSTRDAPSSASTRRRRRPELPDPRTVLGAVKARPDRGRARRQDSTTAGLDGPCARRVCARRPGQRNDRQARTKEQHEVRCDR
ncbi:hypothetical protein ABIB90_002327 [Bradyrhizobium sp. JR4.1]